MRYYFVTLLVFGILLSCNSKQEDKTAYLSSHEMTMAAPIIASGNLFFTDSLEVKIKFAMPNSSIRYTLDGSVVTEESPKYDQSLFLKETTTIKAKSFHPEYKSGATTALKAIRTNTKLEGSTVTIHPAPNERYQGSGTSSLTDLKKGTLLFANDNSWLGFQSDSVSIDINLPKVQSLSKIRLSTMANHGAWIFLPKSIAVYTGGKKIGTTEIKKPSEGDSSQLEFIEIPIEENIYKNLKVIVTSLNEIPEWHQGKGTLPWFFTDEILVE